MQNLERAFEYLLSSQQLWEEVDYHESLDRALKLGIFPLSDDYISRKTGQEMPQFSKTRLELFIRSRVLEHSLAYLHETLPEIPCILLKGAPLGERLFSDSNLRESSDIDIWCEKDSIPVLERALRKIDYEAVETSREWARNQKIFLHPKGLAPVEVHWSLTQPPLPSPSFKTCFLESKEHPKLPKFHLLSENHLYLHLLLHAHQHWGALKPVVDLIGHWDSSPGMDWQLLSESSHKHQLRGISQFFASLVSILCRRIHPLCGSKKPLNLAAEHYAKRFKGLLCSSEKWKEDCRLVWGEDSHTQAAIGVLHRSLSMFLLDGTKQKFHASTQVLINGPHLLGRLHQEGIASLWKSGNV